MVSELYAQKPKSYNSAEIIHKLNRLNVLGSALYVAAHPDDENTKVITYLSNEKHFHTGYLSATRGDGGQNLIGAEIREELGVIRTQELLTAREIDGGVQYFSRANDFGYSKTPDETFNIWNREEVLEDFVKVFRMHKPAVVITRFPTDGGGGHGHHTASAILAEEAFELAADASAYPESAKEFGVWQAKLLVFNTHPFFYKRTGREFDASKFLTLDLGEYNPLLGQSYTEIAALSRSQHKSQGFGATGTRGSATEYFKYVAGEKPDSTLLEGLNTSWTKIKGGDQVAYHVENALVNFDPLNPYLVVKDLIKAYEALDAIDNKYWKGIKQEEIKDLILACTGLYMELKADSYSYTKGDSISVSLEVINRSEADITFSSLDIQGYQSFQVNQKLIFNRPFNMDKYFDIKSNEPYSQPYWLREKGTLGMYKVSDRSMIGQPQNPDALRATASLKIGTVYLDYELPIVFKKNDPVDGEVYRPIAIIPSISLSIDDKVYIFNNGEKKAIRVKATSGKDSVSGEIKLDLPKGWVVNPQSVSFSLAAKEQEQDFVFEVTPPKSESTGSVTAVASLGGDSYSQNVQVIAYDHIPTQTVFSDASSKIVNINIAKKGDLLGYVDGAGDGIPASLRQIGYTVDMLDNSAINLENLSKYDAVILGVRAYNTNDKLKFLNTVLHAYVKGGGTVIVQYNTSHRLVTDQIAPYPIQLSRDRVTVEEATVNILDEKHPVITGPNKITQDDFDGWVQERGLYFPNEWDDKFTPILSSNDPGESNKKGGLLVAEYGEGYFIYTGYSWFRQLPAGVSGAYRIFANMISIGK